MHWEIINIIVSKPPSEIHRITGFSDFVHRPGSKQLEQKHDVSETESVSVLRWGETPTLLGPLERANLDHWTVIIIII
jgi:hypothetical protein